MGKNRNRILMLNPEQRNPVQSTICKPALFAKSEGSKIRCELCPHECLIGEGKSGICKTRINRNGSLLSIAYGNLCARNIDPVEKKPLFHFFPASKTYSIAMAGCNFSCLNCQNWNISQAAPLESELLKNNPQSLVNDCISKQCKSIAYTYSEPICSYEFVLDTSMLAKKNNIKNILISNGYINEKPLSNLIPFIDAANIDIKSFDETVYKKLCGASLKPVLETILKLIENNIWVEITCLLIPGLTDSPEKISLMCNWLLEHNLQNTPIHFSKFFPAFKLPNTPATSNESIENAIEIARDKGINYIYAGNIQGHESENTFCPVCLKKVVNRNRYSVSEINIINGKCLFCNTEISGVWN